MPFNFPNLDDDTRTREFMLRELEHDIDQEHLYISSRLTTTGAAGWLGHLREALDRHDEVWLTQAIHRSDYWNSHETKAKPSGGTTSAKVPSNAAQILAEGEFVRFYLRGVCQRAIEDKTSLQVTRLKAVTQPRPESDAQIGRGVSPTALLADLREHIGLATFLGIPPGPNSGLGVEIV